MSEPMAVDDHSFEEQVIKAAEPVLVDFWAPWCGPCLKMAPAVDELAREYAGKVRFAKLNVQDNSATPSRFGVRSIPTLVIFRAGQEVDRIVGMRPKGDIKKRLDAMLL